MGARDEIAAVLAECQPYTLAGFSIEAAMMLNVLGVDPAKIGDDTLAAMRRAKVRRHVIAEVQRHMAERTASDFPPASRARGDAN